MNKTVIKVKSEVRVGDPIAASMWGNCGTRVFRDKRKCKPKHKPVYEW